MTEYDNDNYGHSISVIMVFSPFVFFVGPILILLRHRTRTGDGIDDDEETRERRSITLISAFMFQRPKRHRAQAIRRHYPSIYSQ